MNSSDLPAKDQEPNTHMPQKFISESLHFLQVPMEEQQLDSQQPKNKMDQNIKNFLNTKEAQEAEEEEKQNVNSKILESNMPPCRSVEEFRQLVELKEKDVKLKEKDIELNEKATLQATLHNLEDQLFQLQLKKIQEKTEAETNTLSAQINLYEQRIQYIKNSLALDMFGPRVPFEPRQGVPLLPEKGIFPPKQAVLW